MNMVIQTGPLLSGISGKHPAAGTKPVQLPDQFDGILHCSRACIRTIITRLILFHLTRKEDSGICFSQSHLNVRICLVILQHRIIFRSMLFNQIAFQDESLKLRISQNIFKSGNVRHHLLNLGTFVPAGLKILAHTVS